MSCATPGIIFVGSDDPVAVHYFVSLGAVFLLSFGVCGVFIFSLLPYIALSVESTAACPRMCLPFARCGGNRGDAICRASEFKQEKRGKSLNTGFTARRVCGHDS